MPDTTNIALQLLQLIALALPAVAIMLQVTNRFAESPAVKMGGTRSDLFSGFFGAALATLFWFSLSAVLLISFLLVSYLVETAGAGLPSILLMVSLVPFVLGILSFIYFAHFPLSIAEVMVDHSGVLALLEKVEAYHEMGVESPDHIEELVSSYYHSTVGYRELLNFFIDWEGITDVEELRDFASDLEVLRKAIEEVEESDQFSLDELVGQEDPSKPLPFRILVQWPVDLVERLFSEET